MASCDALWRAMSPACDCSTSSVTTMLRNISLHASTIHFTLRVQMLTGFIHWHFTNARWTAYECVRVTLLLHCNAALWFTFIQPTPFFLGPKISVVVTSVRLLGMFSQSLMNMICSVFGLIYSRVQYIYIDQCAQQTSVLRKTSRIASAVLVLFVQVLRCFNQDTLEKASEDEPLQMQIDI